MTVGISSKTALVVIDVQRAFGMKLYAAGRAFFPPLDLVSSNIERTIAAFRAAGLPVLHVHHSSLLADSHLNPHVNSGFIGTGLEAHLRDNAIDKLVIVGLTTSHCVSTTTRMAGNLGWPVYLARDATGMFERAPAPGDGSSKVFDAQTMHEVALSELHDEFAEVVTAEDIVAADNGHFVDHPAHPSRRGIRFQLRWLTPKTPSFDFSSLPHHLTVRPVPERPKTRGEALCRRAHIKPRMELYAARQLRRMKLGSLYALGALAVSLPALLVGAQHAKRQSFEDNSDEYIFPVGSPGFYHGHSTAAVTIDQHSLLLDGKRVMIFSGEFHPFRLPAPELWYDVLEKLKAAGFNAVSVYWHWGLTAPNSTQVRFTEHNDLAKFYTVAKEVGVLVIVRPGPYVNAETAGGGIPGWATNIPGLARTNNTLYREAWLPYIEGFAKETAPFQYPDGPVIAVQSENEFLTSATAHIPGLDEHMQDIINVLRENGITKVPTIHNDRNAAGQFSQPGLGKVDLYGWDGYPLGFDCDKPEIWTELSIQHDTSHQRWNPAEPLALFEWQGGAFSYWSGPGYDECYKLINEQFANVYYKDNYAAGASLQNLYMTYGGTNWGNMHCTTIYSSYDYGAALAEDRTQTPKFDELKLQGYFLHASPDYLLVGRVGNGTIGSGTAYSSSPDIFATNLESPKSKTNFYIVRQKTNAKTTDTSFKLRVNTTLEGEIEIPKNGELVLAGRESKIIVTNYPFGSSKLEYSTAEVATWQTFDGLNTILLYALNGQYIEIAAEATPRVKITTAGSKTISATVTGKTVTISGTPSGLSSVTFGKTRVIVADKKTAASVWAPRLASSASGNAKYDLQPEIPSVLIFGPYLVRSASAKGSTLVLTGDLNATTTLDIFAPAKFKSVTWNGAAVKTTANGLGGMRASVAFPKSVAQAKVPVLTELDWKCADSLPELAADYDDSTWTLADKTTTQRPQQPIAGKFVLYAGEYGYHAGQWVWRGHFSGAATGVQLTIQGGFSFGYSAFLNGHFLGSGQGSSISQTGVDQLSPTFNFTAEQLVEGDNVLTIIHDATGLNEDYNIDDEHKMPRGVRGYRLLSTTGNDFTEWRLAGNIGGENAPDAVRGPYNEGGYWFERVGAHLPGFDDSDWQSGCSPLTGLIKPGVTAYRTKFSLDLPKGADIPLAFDFALDSAAPYRTLIYVNGWQFGRFLSSLGPQVSYPIPEDKRVSQYASSP
ncbi:putative beta-galactosidase A [Mycena kentingensis (nom. inval.)]|nr:putative beta-galactosidase A [Mycena kentingensis (nom. inval.)]